MKPFASVVFVLSAIVVTSPAAENVLLRGALESGAVERLQLRYPSVRVHAESEDGLVFYGGQMTAGDTPREAAERWLLDHGDAFGVPGLDLRVTDQGKTRAGRSTAFSCQQFLDGLPVENAIGRILVQNGFPSQVIYAAARLAQAPEDGFAERRVSAIQAVAVVRRMPEYAHLLTWSPPQLVVFYAEEELRLAVATPSWKFSGSGETVKGPSSFTFFVDAVFGKLLHPRNEVRHAQQVTGNVKGRVSPAPYPDTPSNLPMQESLPSLRVRVSSGGTETYTDSRGNYAINVSGPTNLEAELRGPWVTVVDATKIPPTPVRMTLSGTGTPGQPLNFLFSESDPYCAGTGGAQFCTAQINAYLYVTRTHDFYKSLEPDFTGIDVPVTARVNNATTGCAGASFDSVTLTLNTNWANGGCPNTGYASIIAHEYGHFIENSLGLFPAGSFNEGFADSVALLMHDNPLVGVGYCGPGTSFTDYNYPACPRVQYPCGNPGFLCGTQCLSLPRLYGCAKLIAEVWWDILANLRSTHGIGLGLVKTQQLFGNWSRITLGGFSGDSAHPLTAIEVLTMDDNDADLCNGSPNSLDICAAFSAHSIPCPISGTSPSTGVAVTSLGSRYLRIKPSCPPTDPVAIRVRGTPGDPCVSCVSGYLDAQGNLVQQPVYRTVSQWGVVHAKAPDIIPQRTYLADIIIGGAPVYSQAASDVTYKWGDIDRDGFVNTDDVLCTTEYFAATPLANCHTLQQNDLSPTCSMGLPAAPDGFVNVDDTLAVLDAFAGMPFSAYQCSGCTGYSPCSGSGPGGASGEEWNSPSPGAATFQFVFQPRAAEAGSAENVLVDVFADGVQDVRAYQITFDVSGGVADGLRIEDIFIEEDRADYIFAGEEVEHAVNPGNRQMLNAMYWGSVDRTKRAYLGTVVLRRLPGAAGTYHIGADLGIHTLVRNAQSGPVPIAGATNASVTVQ